MIRLFAPIMLITFFASGCATTQAKQVTEESPEPIQVAAATPQEAQPVVAKQLPQPDWIEGESRKYPRLGYMRSRAQAKSADGAKEMAREKLAKLFMVDINTFDMSVHQAKISANYDTVEAFSDEQTHTVAHADINTILEKIEVVDHWHHIESNTHHAIAVIPRNTGKAFLRNEIRRLDEHTSQLIDQGQTDGDPFTQLGMLAKAWRAQQVRSALQKTMTRADLTGRGLKPKWRLKDMEKDINSVLTSLRIFPTGVDQDIYADSITHMLSGALKVAELTPSEQGPADYVISAMVDVSIIGEENGWAIGHGAIKVAFKNKAEEAPRGTKQWELQTPGLHEEHAKRRVMEKTEYMLKKNMRNILIDMAMN